MKPKQTTPETKAIQAWRSELRRLEARLAEWEADLSNREENLEQQEAALEAALDKADDKTVQRYADLSGDNEDGDCACESDCKCEGDCDCDGASAGGGCGCPKCQNTRADWVGGAGFSEMDYPPSEGFKIKAKRFGPKPPVVGDEIEWLEKLWKLSDKRKKK